MLYAATFTFEIPLSIPSTVTPHCQPVYITSITSISITLPCTFTIDSSYDHTTDAPRESARDTHRTQSRHALT